MGGQANPELIWSSMKAPRFRGRSSMNQLRTVRPSPSYTVSVPDAAREEHEGRVSSYWLHGEPVLLQLSSYLRLDGPQVAAHERLQDRVKRHPAN